MASLLRQEKWYYTQFYSSKRNPKRKRIALKTKTLKTAEKLHRELEDKYASGVFDPWSGFDASIQSECITKESTLREALEFYIHKKSREDWRKETAKNTSYLLWDFARFTGVDLPVSVVTPGAINDFLNRKKYAYETKKTHKTKVVPFANWLRKRGLVNYDYSQVKIYNNDHEQDETISYLSLEEIEILKEGIQRRVQQDIERGYQKEDRNALWLIDFIDWQRYSGMRISETLSLTPRSINTATWEVTIGSDSFSTKVKSKQVLPIGDVEILKRIATKLLAICSDPSERLFQHRDRRRTSRTFKKYLRLSLPHREDINVHSLRHTCCIELLRREVPIYTVQRWMRHSSIRTTQKYADLLATDISKAVGEAFNSI
ncbi:tyrosine-type recombinase/integrase [Rhodohalobacter sp. 614A]|uniref:tyrosine-type recombinase/integrase n=1 Tax=Rhodohalobacter sp. 614A TaxID=2908649 RepID=UPI001F269A54|nr:site-specific integrase [Rhodohalobacter sp. 614A]